MTVDGAPRALIVDDDAALLRLLSFVLRDRGFEVVTATNGAEALAQIERGASVVVLDLEMPVMDGRTCYREMRARGVDAPVLILSAYGARKAQLELRANASMDKPFDPDDLITTIDELVYDSEPGG
jgi:CheY-like chemotaxis protein